MPREYMSSPNSNGPRGGGSMATLAAIISGLAATVNWLTWTVMLMIVCFFGAMLTTVIIFRLFVGGSRSRH